MHIVIDIPDEDVSNKQEIIDMSLHFIAGEVCECTYPYIVLPKGHDIIDGTELNKYLDDLIYAEQKIRLDGYETRTDIVERIKINADFLTIIEADKESKDADSD